MRVAFVTMETAHHRPTEGNERVGRIARGLAGRGHDVTVFCSQWWPGYDEVTREEDRVTYRAVTYNPSVPVFATRVPTLVAAHRPDVVHVAPEPAVGVTAAGVGAAVARAPVVAEWFGDEDPTGRWRRRAVERPDRVVTPSELVRTRVREMGASESATRVVPESIDRSLIERTDPAGDADVVYARRLDEHANVQDLLLALAELRDRSWSATIVGDGPRREAYERQAADLRIDDRVTFAGDLPRAERVALYRGAHTFVHTAYRENFATELLWALAAGCVGIVEYQADSSAHELIEGRERGFRVTDPEELADAIVAAGEFERLTVDDTYAEYDHDAVIERYLACYRELLHGTATVRAAD